jgi:ELWxxDGT repeat protein
MPSTGLALKRRPLRLESLEERRLMALVPELVADIALPGYGSEPSPRLVTDDALYFVASTPRPRLFVSDGTDSGTVQLTPDDVYSSSNESFVWLDGRFYFLANRVGESAKIWSSDGTPSGTQVEPIPVPNGSDLHLVGQVNGRLLYVHRGESDFELWSHAIDEEPQRLMQLPYGFSPSQFPRINLDDELVFALPISGNSSDLWKTDGTPLGTSLLSADAETVRLEANANLVALEGAAYFVGHRSDVGTEIWRYNGELQAVTDLNSDQGYYISRSLWVAHDVIYSQIDFSTGFPSGIWKFDGEFDGMQWIAPHPFHSLKRLIGVGDQLVAEAGSFSNISTLYGLDLQTADWQTLASDVNPILAPFANQLTYVNGSYLWMTDGTVAGTQNTGLPYVTRPLAAVGDKLAIAQHQGFWGAEFAVWALGASEPLFARDLNPSTWHSEPWQMTSAGDFIYTVATDYLTGGYNLWKLDPVHRTGVSIAPFSSNRLKDCGRLELIHPDSFLQTVGDDLYFASDFGKELWYTDGTPEGTALLRKFEQRIEWMNDIGGTLVFDVTDAEHGRELWTSDGTPEGTRIVADMNAGPESFVRDYVYLADEAVVFKAHDGRLWRSDGTQEGTYALTDFGVAVTFWSQPTYLEGQIYFRSGDQVYRTDGTIPGTIRILPNFPVTEVIAEFGEMIATESRQYLWSRGVGGRKVWWTSDNGATMHFVAELPAGTAVRYSDHHAVFGEVVLFPVSNFEYYRTDGTAEGTYRLPAVERAENGFFQSVEFLEVQGQLLYQKDNRLWRSDGTVEGSYPITDPFTVLGAGSQKPSYIAHHHRLFATTGVPAPGMEVYEMVSQPGDTNFDGQVDLTDLNEVRNHFGETGNVLGDSNGDGVVDLEDLNAVRNNFGAGGATSSTVAPGVGRPGKAIGLHLAAATSHETSAAWQDMLFVSDTASASQKTTAKRLKALDRVFASL